MKPLHDNSKQKRRNFITKALAALFGATILTKAEDLFAIKSKTGFLYLKQNGEIINNYKPSAGPDPYIGEIGLCAFPFAPNGWMLCNGQTLNIADYDTLFTLLGTTFGGNGTTTFNLPDLRGRIPVHQGQGPGLSNYIFGDTTGVETVTLNSTQIPPHNHTLAAYAGTGSNTDPSAGYISQYAEGVKSFGSSSNTTMNSAAVSSIGGNQAHTNMQPYLTMNYCIALYGIFPAP
ncbi:MAG: phage tail protein [Bacteroidetes bacterium]|nr:phage tail protein [Bacteroidota bacterium]